MTRLDGAPASVVSRALETGDPLPGTAGFAGMLDGRLVRDVLGRRPLFTAGGDADNWAFDPASLSDPQPLPAGSVREDGEERVVWRLPEPDAVEPAAAVARTREAVLKSTRGVDPAGLAVAFSGGIDSALVAAGVPEAPLYVAGFEGCHDIAAAREAAAALGRADALHVIEIDHDDLRAAVPEVVAATGRTNAMDVAIAVPLWLTARRAAADGYDRLAVGQGADELFGGYAKLADPAADDRVAAETVRGARRELLETLPGQAERDVPALRAAGVEPVAPFLHDRVVAAALRLPGSVIATGDERKIALRRAARDVLPESVRRADKKAVQYGTYVARELDRLARQAGFKRRMDDHVAKYIASLVG